MRRGLSQSSPSPSLLFSQDGHSSNSQQALSGTGTPSQAPIHEQFSSPSPSSTGSVAGPGAMREFELALKKKVGEGASLCPSLSCAIYCILITFVCMSETCRFRDKYGYLVESGTPKSGVIPGIKTYPYLRDGRRDFTKEDIEAIRTYLSFIIDSLQDLKSAGDSASRKYVSRTIKSYRNVLESYKMLRNSRTENGKHKRALTQGRDPSYKPSRSAKQDSDVLDAPGYKTRQKNGG
jgi:hypothetical protein